MKQLSGVIAFVVAFVAVRYLVSRPGLDDAALANVANQINETTPFMVDRSTRLDNVYGGNGMLTYNYTLVEHAASEIDANQLVETLRPTIKNTACTSPDMKVIFENGVSVRYYYKGKNGAYIGEVKLTPSDCGY